MSSIKKCMVCGYQYDGDQLPKCPVCKFQEINILGDYEKGLKELQPIILQKKQGLANRLQIGMKIFQYELDGTKLVDKGESVVLFDTVTTDDKVHWLDDHLETVSTLDVLDAEVYVQLDDKTYLLNLKTNNMKNADYIQVGIAIDIDFCMRMVVKDDSNNLTQSEKVYIFNGS